MGRELLILPFGILPLLLLLAYVVWKVLVATGQRTVTDDRRLGETEFPMEVSMLLNGTNEDELSFSGDGRGVILMIKKAYQELSTTAEAEEYVRDKLRDHDEINPDYIGQLKVTSVVATEADRGYRLIMTMPASTVLSHEYIEKEVRNLGRVFTRNTVNHHRFLLFAKPDREVRFSEGKALVRIGRQQLVPTFMGNWTDRVMSERQITRNLKNRMWNLVEVKCTSIDRHTYCGEIMLSR